MPGRVLSMNPVAPTAAVEAALGPVGKAQLEVVAAAKVATELAGAEEAPQALSPASDRARRWTLRN